MMGVALGMPHGAGSNHANAGAPDIPLEPRRWEDPDAFRARMETRSADRRRFADGAVMARAKRGEVVVDDELSAVKFDEPPVVDEPASPVAEPAPAAAQPVPVPTPRAAAAHRTPTNDERDRLAAITAYVDGDSLETIERRLDRPRSTVRGWLVDAGVQLRAGRTPGKDRIRPCAGTCGRQTRPGGVPASAAPDTVCRVRDGLCAPCLKARGGDAPRRYLTAVERDQVVAAYRQGETVPQIATRLGRQPSSIRYTLRAAGVEMRDDRRRPAPVDDQPPLTPAAASPLLHLVEVREGARAVVVALLDAAAALAHAGNQVAVLVRDAEHLLTHLNDTTTTERTAS